MKYSFVPEIVALIGFVYFSVQFIHSDQNELVYQKNLASLQKLEALIPRYSNEVMRSNSTSLLHYDLYAQLHQQIEVAKGKLTERHELNQQIEEYLQLTSHYMQIVTMSKTSKRLISSSELISSDSFAIQNTTFLKSLVQLLTNTQVKHKEFITLLSEIEKKYGNQLLDWPIIKQHVEFLIKTRPMIVELNAKIISSTLLEELSISYHNEAVKLAFNKKQLTLQGSLAISCLLVLLIIVLMRQKQQIKIESDKYQEAADIKTSFLANMSHEIRTPMTGIIGLTELCLATNLNTSQRDYLEKLYFSANSLLTIINDILDFSKIESGKLKIERISFNHEKLVENLDVLVSQQARDKQLELIFDISPKLPQFLIGDQVRIGQVLMNLLSNAVKFTDKGHVILKVDVKDKGSVPFIKYSIKDTGIGITSEQLSKLFSRFTQADDSTTRKYGGTGLGLTISRHLVELMGGEITVKSEKDVGSEFTVLLPFEKGHTPSTDNTVQALEGKSILFVEDSPITSEIVVDMLNEIKLNVSHTDNLAKATLLLNTNTFDIALIDYKLGENTCIPLIKLMEQKSLELSKVIVFSAHDTVFLQEQLNTINIPLDFLSKPLTRSRLRRALSTSNKDLVVVNNVISTSDPNVKNECTKGSGSLPQGKILLVEDNRINQTIATNIVKQFGYEVDVAENGQLALEKIEQEQYDVVLMDIQMPVLDGVQTTKILRNTYTKEELPIVALTANVTAEETVLYEEIGMNHHLSKPYVQEEMKKVLGSIIAI